ncbi:unnamed protein product [Sympodiomycopsis kandeliae]
MASTSVVSLDEGSDQKQIAAAAGKQTKKARPRSNSRSASGADNTRKESLGGAVARSLLGSLAFFFRLPIRLFRPVKLSSWTVLESFAKRERKTLSAKYLFQLIRREKNSFLFHLLGPPIVFNTLVGFTLFESYSLCESHLLRKHYPERSNQDDLETSPTDSIRKTSWTPLWIVTVAGGVAGAAQCILSAPLDNVRLVLTSHRPVGRPSSDTSQHGRRRRAQGLTKPSLISWRSVMKAAILPFAPLESQHRRLVKSVQQPQQASPTRSLSNLLNWRRGEIMTKQQRKVLQQTLKNWSGGIHGSGLLMSLCRDSVGFASFFCIFECSRRVAHGVSLSIDKTIAWYNSSPTLPSIQSSEEHHNGLERVDFSYNSSRTKTGRVIAAFVLLVGGAIGAFAYEWVGRPFELMRVVIWKGRQQYAKSNKIRVIRGGRSERHVLRNGSVLNIGSASKKRRERVQAYKQRVHGSEEQSTRKRSRQSRSTGAYSSASRLESLITLRAANSSGTRLSRLSSLLDANHPPHPLRSIGSNKHRHSKSTTNHSSGSDTTSHPPRTAPPSSAPSAYTLLLQHARKETHLPSTSLSIPYLLLHTYFLAPYTPNLSTPTLSGKLLSKWTQKNPVSNNTSLSTLLPPKPIPARYDLTNWTKGRTIWALRRLASPYGIGFVIFAWMSGDV